MYFLDTSVWIALTISGHIHHGVARAWLEEVEGAESLLFCRSTQQSFLRLLTSAPILSPYNHSPLTNDEAWRTYEAWLSDDRVAFRVEPASIDRHWKEYALRSTPSPKIWMDAYLAAFARAGGYRLVTMDGDFKQFDGLELLLLGAETS